MQARVSSNRRRSLSIALIGNYPPPYGGVQTHIARVQHRLAQNGIPASVYAPWPPDVSRPHCLRAVRRPWWGKRHLNYWGYHWLTQYGCRLPETIIHCHEEWKMAGPLLLLALSGRHVLLTIHDQMLSRRWKALKPWDRFACRLLVRHPKTYWIAVSANVHKQVSALGVSDSRIVDLPAYIPLPAGNGELRDLPAPIREFIDRHVPVICTYAWMLIQDENGNDLHSLDQCVDAIGMLRSQFPQIGLVILIGNASNAELLSQLRAQIRQLTVEEHVLVCDTPLPDAGRLWSSCSAYLRATTTDGDAVSVREALSVAVPVVASDAAARPEGTIVFRTRDSKAMMKAIRYVLDNPEESQRALRGVTIPDNFPPLLELYRHLVKA